MLTACRVSEEDWGEAEEMVARPVVVFDTVLDGPRACGGVLKEKL